MSKVKNLTITGDIELSFLGPDIEEGPLPAVFYFSLSKEDSLSHDPYNQPSVFLSSFPLRVFSITLPGHGPGLPPTNALHLWSSQIAENQNIVAEFVEKTLTAFHFLERHEIFLPNKLAVMGLSRGAFIATHVAAKAPFIKHILGFAPLTQLTFANEFSHLHDHPLAESLNISHLIPHLVDRHVRFYIGNHDTKVGTATCFDFIYKLSETAFEKGIRSPTVDLIIGPSIGHKGHGTAKEVFEDGAKWLVKMLEVSHGS